MVRRMRFVEAESESVLETRCECREMLSNIESVFVVGGCQMQTAIPNVDRLHGRVDGEVVYHP